MTHALAAQSVTKKSRPKPTLLKFYLDANDDPEITCLICGNPRCDQSVTFKGGGNISIRGVHSDCAQKHLDRMCSLPKGDS